MERRRTGHRAIAPRSPARGSTATGRRGKQATAHWFRRGPPLLVSRLPIPERHNGDLFIGVQSEAFRRASQRSSIGRDTQPTPTWSAMVCSDTRPTVTLSLRPCTRLRAPGRALPIVVALRHRPGGAVRPRPPYACAWPLEPYRREARRGRRVVRCALLGPPHEPGPARSAASTCQLHSS